VFNFFVIPLGKFLHGTLKINRDVAFLFFCIPCILSCCFFNIAKLKTILSHELHEVFSQVLACKIHFVDRVAQSKALVDWHCACD
jgi:hypothetical protein